MALCLSKETCGSALNNLQIQYKVIKLIERANVHIKRKYNTYNEQVT